jgi:hypothetical protein
MTTTMHFEVEQKMGDGSWSLVYSWGEDEWNQDQMETFNTLSEAQEYIRKHYRNKEHARVIVVQTIRAVVD